MINRRTLKRELEETLNLYLTKDMEKEIKKALKVKTLNINNILNNKRYIINQLSNIRYKNHFKTILQIIELKVSEVR